MTCPATGQPCANLICRQNGPVCVQNVYPFHHEGMANSAGALTWHDRIATQNEFYGRVEAARCPSCPDEALCTAEGECRRAHTGGAPERGE